MTITWLLNKNITFASDTLHHNKWVEGASYMLIMIVGASINFLIYTLLMLSSEVVRSYPILGVSVGTGIALIWNFNVARTVLYRRRD
jgi:putative flippase GtrA